MQTGATTTADANGVFEFQNVALTLGTNTFTAEVIDAAGNKTAVNLSVERIEPFIDGGLKLDTGKSNVDGKTSDSTITGQFTLPGQLAELLGSFDGSSFVKLSPTLNADGSFTLDRAQLAQLKGGTLTDGAYTLSLKAKDTLGNFSTVKTVVFDLDTAAPELEIQELIDGIRWKEGEKLKGTLKNLALESGTVVFYQFDGQGAIQQLQLNAEGGFEKLLNIPDNAGSHTLKVFSVDDAGNQKAVDFSFLVKGTRPIVDDDEFVSDDPTNPPPTSPSDPYWSDGNTAGSWFNGSGTGTGGSGGSGMWGYGVSPGNSPAVIPSGANPNGDPNAPENKPLTYLEKVSIILDQAMQSISTSPETVTKKAALKNRLSLLMEVADLVDEQRLYDRMRLTFYGIYDEADDLITNRQQAYARGTELAAEIIADPDAMKLETFQATLVGVVNQVFAQQGYTVGSTAKEESLVNALLELAETYASLNPTRATDNASTPDFLDSLWRVQQTINPRTPLSLETIRAELERGVGALDNLLDGVQNKAQALKFVNNLLLAASETASLDGEAIYDAQFLRELVAFGFEYAKLNPNDLANATENGTEAFLGTFWQNTVKDSTAMRQATGKLDDLFARLETKEERLKLLKFETNLLKAIGLSGQELLEEKQDAQFLSAIVGLGGAYAALNPIANSAEPIDFFLDTLWNAQNEAGLQKGIGELSSFVQDFDDSTQIIRYQQKLLTTFKLVPDFQQIEYNPAFIKDFFKLSSYHAFLQVDKTSDVSDSLLSKVWEAKNEEDLRLVANNFQKMFAQVIDGNYIANNSSTNIATILHQEIIEQAQQTIPDAGVQEWNIWRAGATRLGITDIYEFKTQWVYGYRNVINYAASLFNIPATLLAGVIHMEVGGDPQVQDDIVHGLRGVIPDGFGGSLGIPESQTSFGNLSVQIETAARVLGYVSVQDLSQNRLEELISRQQILLILESLKDPRMNILIGAAYLSDLRDKYAPGEPAQQLTENDLIVIGSAYNYGEYEYDEDTLSITQNPINYDFLLNRWNYGRDALQRVEQYQLDRVLVGDYPDE